MINSIGRALPDSLEKYGRIQPYDGDTQRSNNVGNMAEKSEKAYYGKKEVCSLEKAVALSGLKPGMRISFHHHLRLGDRVVGEVLRTLTAMGLRDLTVCLSSIMGEACQELLNAVKAGTVSVIETTGLKSPLSEVLIRGELPNPVVFRSHGGRARSIIEGETPIDVAFLAASAMDRNGNMNGVDGPNRFGALGYARADAEYAAYVIGITDYIVPETLEYIGISGNCINCIVTLPSIGIKEKLSGGTLRNFIQPIEQIIANQCLKVLTASGYIHEGFSFQAGSGGISLAAARLIADYLKQTGIRGSFVSGGGTAVLTSLLESKLVSEVYDVQSFDDTAASKLGKLQGYKEMSASQYANPHHPGGCIAEKLDIMLLSATEVDLDFHVNSLTGTDGRLIGALGGAPDTAFGAKLTVVVLPSFRGRIPSINSSVRTVCTPGSCVDLVITERGLAVNPRREDLLRIFSDAGIECVAIEALMGRIHTITGTPKLPDQNTGRPVGLVEYRDGTVIDCIRSI